MSIWLIYIQYPVCFITDLQVKIFLLGFSKQIKKFIMTIKKNTIPYQNLYKNSGYSGESNKCFKKAAKKSVIIKIAKYQS